MLFILGQLPKRVIVGFVSASALNGNYHSNPYSFSHYDHTNVLLTSDSNTHIRPIKSNFSKGLYLQAYLSIFTACGIHFNDQGNGITRDEYPNGHALIGFDLTEDLSASDNHWALPRQGALRLDLQFAKPLPETICVIVYAEFDSLIEIDKDRNVYLDYAS